MNLVKRLWCRVRTNDHATNYLQARLGCPTRVLADLMKVDSTQEIARRNDPCGIAPTPYIAVLAFDGDKMGVAFNHSAHQGSGDITALSRKLSEFALENVARVIDEHYGYLVYAGGDDVLAIIPSRYAIDCARAFERLCRRLAQATAVGRRRARGVHPRR